MFHLNGFGCLYSSSSFLKFYCWLISHGLLPESAYEFDKTSLLEYNLMSFGGPPVTVDTVEEADELMQSDEKQSAIGMCV